MPLRLDRCELHDGFQSTYGLVSVGYQKAIALAAFTLLVGQHKASKTIVFDFNYARLGKTKKATFRKCCVEYAALIVTRAIVFRTRMQQVGLLNNMVRHVTEILSDTLARKRQRDSDCKSTES